MKIMVSVKQQKSTTTKMKMFTIFAFFTVAVNVTTGWEYPEKEGAAQTLVPLICESTCSFTDCHDDIKDTEEDEKSTRSDEPKRIQRIINTNPTFLSGVSGVQPLVDENKIIDIQQRVQNMCGYKKNNFPGCQLVSMDKNNLKLLGTKPYKVSWKADGTRYMLLIQNNGEIFFIDRDNNIFEVSGIVFPHPRNITRNLRTTLLDGEMVIDRVNGKEYPRHLVYDIIMYDGKNVRELPFFPERYCLIENVMKARYQAAQDGQLHADREPFSIIQKRFWDLTQTNNLLTDNFTKQLDHEIDGIVFEPTLEPYTTGLSPHVLKWKPLSLNSIDFCLRIVSESDANNVTKKIGNLYVEQLNEPYGQINITKAIENLNNKIIECYYMNNQWFFLRERTDKSLANSYIVAQKIFISIRDPVTAEDLIDFITNHRFIADSNAHTTEKNKNTTK